MFVIPLDVKGAPAFHTWNSSDQPEVCPCDENLPFLQTRNRSEKFFQTFHSTNYQSKVSNPRYHIRLFQAKTAIEYP
jgi:hypothetical protein